ncbi:MAG TPA: SGNH/GDSL hydrolase family protein, partial [Verrucomicrobiae bacterium]|nr:SGNH/GDSL hydrolase family protein [Verrucomicrobiae bacterium]
MHLKNFIALFAITICCAQLNSTAAEGHWVTTWGCGPQLTEPGNLPPVPLANSTLRQFVHTTIGGKHLRVRLSNAYGTDPVTINLAHVALAAGAGSAGDGEINTNTDKALTFHGAPSTVIPPGEAVLSDPLDFDLPALTNLAITIYFGKISATTINGHPGSRTTFFIKPGNVISDADMTGASKAQHWYIITGVEVLADSSAGAVVTLGDSITDGRGPADNTNARWPDDFARRLNTNAPTANVAVVNMGIGGGTVLFGGLGPTALKRFDRDVLGQSGVKWLIVFEGVNDIGGNANAANLIAAYTQFANKAHAHGIRAYGATITPFGGNGYYSVSHEAVREAVNQWFRTNSIYDGVIDFDAAVRDPANPTKFQAAFFAGPFANDWL